MEEKKAVLFDIGRYRNTDGPGIRTILFFKGCPLRCKWCSNPFGLSKKRQLVVNPSRCTGCGTCVEVCHHQVNIVSTPGEPVQVEFQNCTLCGDCIDRCLNGARTISGKEYTPRELAREAGKDAAFYRRGGGGVTVSGGEVMLQWEAAAETLRLCRSQNLNTCMETSGFGPWEHLWAMAQYCHTVFMDLKHIDSARHRELTGVGNERILVNMERLCDELPKRGGRVIIRMPLVPGFNDDDESVASAARFVAGLPNAPELNLLPYHDLGATKYEMIGEEYQMPDVESRKKKDPRIQAIFALCRACAPENRVSLGGEAIDLTR